jgi:hypothetical protein
MIYHTNSIKMFYENNKLELNVVYKNYDYFHNSISKELPDDYTYADIRLTNVKLAQDLYTENDECLLYKYEQKFDECDNMKELRQYEKLLRQISSVIYKKRTFIRKFYLQLK